MLSPVTIEVCDSVEFTGRRVLSGSLSVTVSVGWIVTVVLTTERLVQLGTVRVARWLRLSPPTQVSATRSHSGSGNSLESVAKLC